MVRFVSGFVSGIVVVFCTALMLHAYDRGDLVVSGGSLGLMCGTTLMLYAYGVELDR